MPHTLGLDVGTSAVKAVVIAPNGSTVARARARLAVDRPRPGWSEQDAHAIWDAARQAIAGLPAEQRRLVRAVGLSGQMHGAVALDVRDRPLRPVILWNDGRSARECADLEAAVPDSRRIVGNQVMAGFTAPKLLWMARHEPEAFAATRTVLLPKDYVRLRLTGDRATDMSDASGTMWLEVGRRDWSDEMLEATGLARRHMPTLHEGSEATGRVSRDVAAELGIEEVPVAAGGGDNAASACGVGAADPGEGFLSLGTSGVIFVTADGYAPAPGSGVHTFCHALPDRWHQMAVVLSAASALDWAAATLGYADTPTAVAAAQGHDPAEDTPTFLPYLTGERTPHNDPEATAAWLGLRAGTGRPAMMRAALEGVAFALADGADALRAAGNRVDALTVVGGGAAVGAWPVILATALGARLDHPADGHEAASAGAARLARLALTGDPVADVITRPEIVRSTHPDAALAAILAPRRAAFRAAYRPPTDSRTAP